MKRPMVWFGLAFVFGEILGFMSFRVLAAAVLPVIFLCVWSGRKRSHIRERICFFALPVFYVWGGACLMTAQQKESRLTGAVDSLPEVFCGTVTEIEVADTEQTFCLQTPEYKIRCVVDLQETPCVPEMLDQVEVQGKVSLFDRATNPGCYDAYLVNRQENLYYQIWQARVTKILKKGPVLARGLQALRRKMNAVIAKSLPPEQAGMLSAMVTGDRSAVPDEINSLYQSQGISHVLALSGLHVGIAGMGIYKILKFLCVPPPFRQALSLLTVVIYIGMCGFSVSSIRAVIMFAAVLIGELIGRSGDRSTALLFAAMVILVRSPYALFSFSFLMSFGCIFSIIVMTRLQGKLAGVYITALTMPVLAWFMYEVPLYSVLLNMVVVPAMNLLFPLGFLGSLCGCLWFPAGRLLCLGAGLILKLYELLCRFTSRLPLSVIITGRPSLAVCAIIYGALSVMFMLQMKDSEGRRMVIEYLRNHRPSRKSDGARNHRSPRESGGVRNRRPPRHLSASADRHRSSLSSGSARATALRLAGGLVRFRYVFLLAYLLLIVHPAPRDLEVLFLDVGQGDSCIVRATDGSVLMVDGGSTTESEVGRYTIEKVLKYYGIDTVDELILSHMDQDHVNGALWMLEDGWNFRRIVLSEVICNTQMRDEILDCAMSRHVPVSEISAGDAIKLGEGAGKMRVSSGESEVPYGDSKDSGDSVLTVRCLGPDEDFKTDSDNAASAVLEMTYGRYRFLLTGDVEGDGEERLIQHMREDPVGDQMQTVLKVAHHGSKYSTSEDFLALARPEYAIISCAKRNRYGHPHPELLERLADTSCRVLNTSDDGAVLFQCDGQKMAVYTMNKR